MSSILPENIYGKSVDIEHYVAENIPEEAQLTFERTCAKLVSPAAWHLITGGLSAKFTLHPTKNKDDNSFAEAGEWF